MELELTYGFCERTSRNHGLRSKTAVEKARTRLNKEVPGCGANNSGDILNLPSMTIF